MRKELIAYWGFLSFSILGVTVFILLPFADVVRRSFVTTMSNQYTGLTNYKNVVENEAFVLAVKNTLHFIIIAIPLLVAIGLIIAFALSKIKDISVIKALYLFPMAMPTATIVIVWRMFFYKQDFDSLVISYLWKIIGYTVVLWLAGIATIPNELLEASKVDGANRFQCFLYVKLPCLRGSFYTIVILSVLNSFKIYREAYLVAGSYPKPEIYLLQHLFNNWYVKLELDKMAVATVLVAGFLFLFIMLLNNVWNRENV